MADSSEAYRGTEIRLPAGEGINLHDPAFRANPYPVYAHLRDQHPVVWDEGVMQGGGWVATGYGACQSILRDSRFIKEGDRLRPPSVEPPPLSPARRALIENMRFSMLFRDPPDHTRLRALVSRAFTPRHLERLRPRIDAMANSLADALENITQVDLIRDFAFPLPVTVIAELLGLPVEDRDRFRQWSAPLAAALDPTSSEERITEANQGMEALRGYFREIVDQRKGDLRDDLISALISARDEGDRLSEDELLGTATLLLVAGFETTVNLIGNAVWALCRHPEEQKAALAQEPLLPSAIEELLRFESPVQMTVRFASEPVLLEDCNIRRGDLVVVFLGAANRDPAVFDNPDRLDVRRDNASRNLAFATGIHVCLGAPLARLESTIALGVLWRRFPFLHLAGVEPLEWKNNVVLRGLTRLPILLN